MQKMTVTVDRVSVDSAAEERVELCWQGERVLLAREVGLPPGEGLAAYFLALVDRLVEALPKGLKKKMSLAETVV